MRSQPQPAETGLSDDGLPDEGRRRAMIEEVRPRVDDGRFPVKRVRGEELFVEATIFTDGHDVVRGQVLVRPPGGDEWSAVEMEPSGNDRWRGRFAPETLGRWSYTVRAWVDRFASWRRDLGKRVEAGVETELDFQTGAEIVEAAANGAESEEIRAALESAAERLRTGPSRQRARTALGDELRALMLAHGPRSFPTRYPRELEVLVERERARFSSWYELFPRSTGPAGEHGTFRDLEEHLPYVARMGFDVLYLPPIHPIGTIHRKGKNNARVAAEGDVGSPWAIGSAEGGHDAIHPDLGTPEDFRRLVEAAREHGLEIALDLALQCAPDHPWVEEHPEWFRRRPDGSIQYAENPPKRYEDIYPIDFETEDWEALWLEIRRVVEHWVEQGVRVFRVDNPHTKSFRMWEWLIRETQRDHPDLIYLSEAFTRPAPSYRLAKLGFTQSYNYFPWRRHGPEIREYLTELTKTDVAEYFRPNLWPNTPDILTDQLQSGGRPMFVQRLVLAATLGASYGIYGPAFELLESEPREPGSEEYLDSEKYQLRDWDLGREDSLAPLIARINRIRRQNPALQTNRSLEFHDTENERLLAYSKTSGTNAILVVVNLDPHQPQGGWVDLRPDVLGVDPERGFQARELLSDARYWWQGNEAFVELDPETQTAMVMRVDRRPRTERDFDYYL